MQSEGETSGQFHLKAVLILQRVPQKFNTLDETGVMGRESTCWQEAGVVETPLFYG